MHTKRTYKLCLTALCLATLSGSALAQGKPVDPKPAKPAVPLLPPPTNPFLPPAAPAAPAAPKTFFYSVIPFETLEPTLTLTPEQSKKIKPIYAHLDEETNSLKAAAKTPEEKRAAGDKIRKAQTDANTEIDAALTLAQREKAQPLMLEMLRMASIGVSPQMLKELKLTSDQRQQFMKLVEAVQAKMNAMPKTDRRSKYDELAMPERAKIPALLTEPQKVVFDKYNDHGLLKSDVAARNAAAEAAKATPVKAGTDKPVPPVPLPPVAPDKGPVTPPAPGKSTPPQK